MTHSRRSGRVIPLPALTLSAALVASACGGDGTATNDTTTTVAAPDTTPTTEPDSPGQLIEFHEFAAGDCFDERLVAGQGQVPIDIEGRIAADAGTATTIATEPVPETEEKFLVECPLPHDNEVYFITEMDDVAGAPFPGVEAVTEFADTVCFDAFEGYVGQQYELSALEIAYLIPTEQSWVLPDREVVCFVFNRSGPKLEDSVEGLGL